MTERKSSRTIDPYYMPQHPEQGEEGYAAKEDHQIVDPLEADYCRLIEWEREVQARLSTAPDLALTDALGVIERAKSHYQELKNSLDPDRDLVRAAFETETETVLKLLSTSSEMTGEAILRAADLRMGKRIPEHVKRYGNPAEGFIVAGNDTIH